MKVCPIFQKAQLGMGFFVRTPGQGYNMKSLRENNDFFVFGSGARICERSGVIRRR
jgi:hypothetical protein